MKPLILEYAEETKPIDFDFSLIEYSDNLNLSVLKNDGSVAIEKSLLGTETYTKTSGEDTDTDRTKYEMSKFFDTTTITEARGEGTDSD